MKVLLNVGGDDHIGGLDDRGDLASLAEAKLLDGLDRDRGDQALTANIEADVGDRCALVDALDRARQLITRAELHEKPPGRVASNKPRNRRRGERSVSSTVSEKQSRDVAEAARESEWKLPSFGKELFLGNFRLDLIHPQPKLSADAVEKGERFLAELRTFLENKVDPLQIERDAKIPEDVVDGLKEMGALGM